VRTHPANASLGDPLFAYGGKRVDLNFFLPSFPLAEERVAE